MPQQGVPQGAPGFQHHRCARGLWKRSGWEGSSNNEQDTPASLSLKLASLARRSSTCPLPAQASGTTPPTAHCPLSHNATAPVWNLDAHESTCSSLPIPVLFSLPPLTSIAVYLDGFLPSSERTCLKSNPPSSSFQRGQAEWCSRKTTTFEIRQPGV